MLQEIVFGGGIGCTAGTICNAQNCTHGFERVLVVIEDRRLRTRLGFRSNRYQRYMTASIAKIGKV